MRKYEGILRAVIYIRYSSHKQNDSYSIEYQLEECQKYIERQGYRFVKKYVDKAKTGKKVAGRDAFDEMTYDAGRGLFDVIIVFSFSRSFRNTREALNYNHDMLEKHGIYIESVIEPIDMTSPHGKFSSINLFAMHELQSDITAGHVKAGMYQAAQQGYFLGGYVPYGYELYETGEFNRGKEKRKYRPHPEEMKVVQMMFELYGDGFSLNYIQEIMKKSNTYGRKGKIMGVNTIARILHNDFYIGVRRYQIKGYDEVVSRSIPPIIDDETWARVQARHNENQLAAPRKKGKRLYELTGKIICAKCGSHYFGTYKNDKRNPDWSASYYTCAQKKGQRNCDSKNIRKEIIDEFVIKEIKKNVLNEDAINEIAAEIVKQAGNNPTDIQARIKELERRKTMLISSEKELVRKDLRGEISKETFNELNAEFKDEIANINIELMELDSAAHSAISLESVKEYLENMLLNIDSTDPDILKNIFDKLIEKIVVDDEAITLWLVVSTYYGVSDKTTSGHPFVQLSSSTKHRKKWDKE